VPRSLHPADGADGHALIGGRQRVPREHIEDPVKSLVMGLPLDLAFRTKGQLAIDISTDAAAGLRRCKRAHPSGALILKPCKVAVQPGCDRRATADRQGARYMYIPEGAAGVKRVRPAVSHSRSRLQGMVNWPRVSLSRAAACSVRGGGPGSRTGLQPGRLWRRRRRP
jgi:hypothetical protein